MSPADPVINAMLNEFPWYTECKISMDEYGFENITERFVADLEGGPAPRIQGSGPRQYH
jgi:hypothetical protein